RPVAFGVGARVAADEAAGGDDASREVGQRAVDAGVDDGDLDGLEVRRRRRPRVERMVVGEIPLLRGERVGRRERGGRRRGDERDEERKQEDATRQRTTICGAVVAAAYPGIAARDTRYVSPEASDTGTVNVPSAATAALPTVAQDPSGLCCWMSTVSPASTGCSLPATSVAVKEVSVTLGATLIRTYPVAAAAVASRESVVIVGRRASFIAPAGTDE